MLPETARRKVHETEQRLGHWDAYVRSIYITVLVIMAYLLGYEFDLMAPLHGGAAVVGALWAAVTVLAVYKDDRVTTRSSFFSTMGSALLGAAVALAYLVWIPPHMWDLALIIVLAMLMSQVLGFADRGRQVVSTLLIIVIFSHLNNSTPWVNAAMRTVEVLIGAGVGLLGGYFGEHLPGLDEEQKKSAEAEQHKP